MAEQEISFPDSQARVALDLAKTINYDETSGRREHKDRAYWLTLYEQCLTIVRQTETAEEVLSD